MNRTVAQAAAVLGLKQRDLFQHLRALKIINAQRELLSSQRATGRFFVDTRSRWNKTLHSYSHYGVVMVTEAGIAWLAKQLGISITVKADKDAA